MLRTMFADESAVVPGSVQWWSARQHSPVTRRARSGGLNLDAIAAATIQIIEDEGLDAVTMRRVADQLDTGPASLYRHISGRDELLVVVADKVLDVVEATTVDERVGWRDYCEQAARGYRTLMLARPALVPLLRRTQLLGPNSLRGRELMLRHFVAHDFPPLLAVHTYLAVVHYVMGAVQVDERSTKRDAAEREALTALFAGLDPDTYPTVVQLSSILGGLEPDEEFEFGLRALLDGIAAALERTR
jgi:TetR/AcrR family tetracycline transcriptional repressor